MLVLLLATLAFAAEPELLQKYPKVFQRNGDTLTVTTKTDSKKYRDSIEGDDGRVRTTVEAYFPKARAAILRHAFVGSELYDVVSLTTGHALHAGGETPLWKNGLFAALVKSTAVIGLCDARDCTILTKLAGSGPLELLARDQVKIGEGEICVVKRAARTVTCSKAKH
jgi:hypothetical protein